MKMFDAGKTRTIGLPYGEKNDNMLSHFHLIPERVGQTDGQTDGRRLTDRMTWHVVHITNTKTVIHSEKLRKLRC